MNLHTSADFNGAKILVCCSIRYMGPSAWRQHGEHSFVRGRRNRPCSLRTQRFLEPNYTVTTAENAQTLLAIMAERGPFAVVVSDLHMPGIDGVELLSTIREQYPDTVRVLLTGHVDIEQALKAVNDGHVFRLLAKPCSLQTLKTAVAAAAAQHDLILSDRRRIEEAPQVKNVTVNCFESNPHPMWVYESNTGKFLAVNGAAVRQYGYTRDEFLGMTTRDIALNSVIVPREAVLSNHATRSPAPS